MATVEHRYSRVAWASWRRATTGGVLAFLLAFHLVTASHELLGHGLLAALAGASIHDVYLASTGGAGFVRWGGVELVPWQRAVVSWGGIAVTIALGVAAWHRCRRVPVASWAHAVTWAVAVCAFGSAFGYAVLGLYNRYGDPRVSATQLAELGWLGPVVALAVLAHAGVFFGLSRAGARLTRAWSLGSSRVGIVFALLVYVGVSAGVVASLNRLEAGTRSRQVLRQIQRSDAERGSQADLEAVQRAREERGEPPLTAAEQQAFLAEREAMRRPWPGFNVIYFGVLAVAVGFGASTGGGSAASRADEVATSVPSVPKWLLGAAAGVVIAATLASAWW